jgi:carboxymethylenebutenolidase
MTTERVERISARGGEAFDAFTVAPEAGSGAGILLLQEIFGVNDYIRQVAGRLAELGYVALAPDLYWRMEPHVEIEESPEGVQRGIEHAQRFDFDAGLEDCGASLDHLRGLPEVTGKVAVLGLCFGGTLAYHVGLRFGPDVVVSYYGSGVPDALDDADALSCPALFHFGGADPYIPRERVEEARRVLEPRPETEFHVHEGAAHAFDNPSPMFHHTAAAAAAWETTVEFLKRHLTT